MAAPLTEKQQEAVLNEARAKITWGTEPTAIRAWLVSKGVDEAQADEWVQRTVLDLKKDTRRQGTFDLAMGLPLVAFSAHAVTSWQFANSMWGGVILAVPGLAGAALLVRAYVRLTAP